MISAPIDWVEVARLLTQSSTVDLSPTFQTNMPGWPTHPSMGVISDARSHELCGYYAQTLVISEHTGSHVDAPAHFHASMPDRTIEMFPVLSLVGPFKKFDFTEWEFGAGDVVSADIVEQVARRDKLTVEPGDIVLLEMGWDRYYVPDETDPVKRGWWGSNQPGLSERACDFFGQTGIKAIGSDTPACDVVAIDGEIQAAHGHATHFLPRGILIMEGLMNLSRVPPTGLFVALPLKIRHGSGSPLRPVAIF